jgi:hypothetical protein
MLHALDWLKAQAKKIKVLALLKEENAIQLVAI